MRIIFDQKSLALDIQRQSQEKFASDAVCSESEKYIIQSEGYFLNLGECLQQYGCRTAEELIWQLIRQGKPLPTVLKGTYVVVVFDKQKKELFVYNDLLSKRSVFYSYDSDSGIFCCSDSFSETLTVLKKKGLRASIDDLGVKMMLAHRMFYDDVTYVKEIKFLCSHEYIMMNTTGLEVRQIPRPEQKGTTLDEAARNLHKLFEAAVRLQYQKNQENGYPQVITLSGGMDSRSTFLYSQACGFTTQQCYCYAESGSADFLFAEELANKYKCEFFFHSISNGNFLQNRDDMCTANDGQMTYSGSTGVVECLEFFDTHRMGLVHTGLGGGEILGDMCVPEAPGFIEKTVNNLKYRLGKGKKDVDWASLYNSLNCSEEDLTRIMKWETKYNSFNEFQNLCDIRRCLNSQKTAAYYGCYYVSPFLDEDFFCYLLSVPYSLKKDRRLYVYWQKKYNPGQFATKSTFQVGVRPGNKIGYYLKRYYIYVANKMGRKTLYDMTPYEYWEKTNPIILQKQQEMYDEDIRILKGQVDENILSMITKGWQERQFSKSNILTATWALKRLLNSANHESTDCCS